MDSHSHTAATETIPVELTGQRPRRVRLSDTNILRATIAKVLVAIGVAGAAWTGIGAVHSMQQRDALRERGIQAPASITSVRREGSDAATSVRYSFSAAGKTLAGKSAVPNQLVPNLKAAASLPIRYLPSDPSINHPADWAWSADLLWDPLVGPIVFAAAGLCSLLLVRRQRRFVVNGVAVLATVTDCALGSGRAGWYTLTYKFRAEDGREAGGSVRSESAQDVGSEICVLYLPRHPGRNIPYTSATYRAVES